VDFTGAIILLTVDTTRDKEGDAEALLRSYRKNWKKGDIEVKFQEELSTRHSTSCELVNR
jgi:hypothetical protein